MAELRCYQVDAFATRVFEGNPAAVVPLDEWLDDEVMQKIAEENNLSETAFFVPAGDDFKLRWFTPTNEASLCGHATLAAAFVLMTELEPARTRVRFDSASGPLRVEKGYTLDFPARVSTAFPAPAPLVEALGATPLETLRGEDWLCVFDDITRITPDFGKLKLLGKDVIVTARGSGPYDFVSRYFAPGSGIDEDPVTGAGHVALAPFWSHKLNKTTMTARQLSKRGGEMTVRVDGDRVHMTGEAVLVKRGTFHL